MTEKIVLLEKDSRGVGTVTLNRPEVRNAYNADLLEAFAGAVTDCAMDDAVRVILIRGNGSHFQAGADLNWIKANTALSATENHAVSANTTATVKALSECEKPVVVLVQGGCFGGGIGIIASADIAIAEECAEFAITEARWGLVASPILPQLAAAMGQQHTRRYALTAERFDAARALDIGLIHHVCPDGGLDDAAAPVLDYLLKAGPNALRATKRLIFDVTGIRLDDETVDWIVDQHASQRQTPEAAEGLASFLERRKPSWYPEGGKNG